MYLTFIRNLRAVLPACRFKATQAVFHECITYLVKPKFTLPRSNNVFGQLG
jgi:hypothetical protein